MSDFNVLERIFGFLSHGTTGPADPLEGTDPDYETRRRIAFDPTYGQHEPIAPEQRYIPGELDFMARERGIASDDPYQLSAKLEAWKQYGHQRKMDDEDRRMLREYLER